MPVYEYQCQACNTTFEVWQKINEISPVRCELCQGEVKRIFHPVGIIFKGNGFYTTDYRRKPKRKDSPPKKDSNKESKSDNKSS